MVTARDMETNRRGDERRELDATEPAVTLLLLETGDFDDDVCLRAVIHDAQARLAPYCLAHLAHCGGRHDGTLIRCRFAGGGGGEDVDPHGFLAAGVRLAGTDNGAESDCRHGTHSSIIAPLGQLDRVPILSLARLLCLEVDH